MIRVLELFAGIGACSKALTNLGIEHEIVDAVEIDKYAIKSFNAIHGTNFEPQDITKWNKDIKADLIMHGSPCQDFSVAGKNAGGDEGSGTRSSLLYETLRIVEKVQPDIVIWENVKNLLSKRHKHNHDAYIQRMGDMGYDSVTQILNAKDYGIPQNRERVFTLSIKRGSKLVKSYVHPWPRPLELRLKDVLEPQVDEKYYLSDEQTKRLKMTTYHSGSEKVRVQNTDGEARTLCARDYKDPKCVRVGGLYDKDGKTHQAGSVFDPQGIAATLSTMQGGNQEPIVVASRGRNPENPSDRSAGQKLEQRLEPNTQGITNTITSVQKDNYVAEPKTTHRTAYERNFGSKGKLQDTNDAVQTLQAGMGEGGGNVPIIPIHTANKKGYDMATDGDGIDLSYPQSATRRGRVGHGVAKTIPTSDSQGTLDGFRIRKLTPRECWRLMGFDDADFDKAQAAGISNTQLYKQAGNSIVVNCLEAIFDGIEWSDNG